MRAQARWFLLVIVAACGPAARLEVHFPVASQVAPDKLALAFSVVNSGTATAENVQVTALAVRGARLDLGTKLPAALGPIAPSGGAPVQASFVGAFADDTSYPLSVEGSWVEKGRRYTFTTEQQLHTPPKSPGNADAKESDSPPNKVNGGKLPEEPPTSPDDANEVRAPRVPTGPHRDPPPPSPETSTQKAPIGDPPGVNFHKNDSLGLSGGSTTAEPSGAVGSDVIFVTTNSFGAYSNNGGSSFNKLKVSTIFPNGADGGFCCDQIVVYSASIDRFIWLMQFSRGRSSKGVAGKGPNRYRIAAASPTDVKSSSGTSWTYWDITSTQLGYGDNWVDYPDMSVGTNDLYVSFDEVGVGRTVVRIPLSEIQSGSTIHFRYTDASKGGTAYGGHLTQQTGDEAFWAGHNNSSSMRVFSWKEGSNTYYWRDVNIGSWPNNTLSSTTPDGKDWLTKLDGFPGNAVLGSTRVQKSVTGKVEDHLWFAWTASKGSNFKQAHVQWVDLDRDNNFNIVTQNEIWNSDFAFAYPDLAINSNSEVGLSLETGGGKSYENHGVGFWGDFLIYITTSSDVGITRFGDYVTIRRHSADHTRFEAFGYGLDKPGTMPDVRYILFGR